MRLSQSGRRWRGLAGTTEGSSRSTVQLTLRCVVAVALQFFQVFVLVMTTAICVRSFQVLSRLVLQFEQGTCICSHDRPCSIIFTILHENHIDSVSREVFALNFRNVDGFLLDSA